MDTRLAHARPDLPLAERVAWAEDLLSWVRRDVPAVRLRLLFQLLARQPEAYQHVAQTLRSIVRDTEALDLFADTATRCEAPQRGRDPGRDDVFEAATGQIRARRVFQGRIFWFELLGALRAGPVVRFFHCHQATRDHGC